MARIILEPGIVEATRECEYFVIYHNRDTGETWANVYTDCNSWTQYKDTAIIKVACGSGERSVWRGWGMNEQQIIAAVEESIILHEKTDQEWDDQQLALIIFNTKTSDVYP